MKDAERSGHSAQELNLPRRLLLQRMAASASLAVAAGSPVLAQDAPAAAAAPAPPQPEPDATTAKFFSLLTELSNWNRWGPDDQMGTVNLITPAVRKAALALAREGATFSLSHDLELKKTVDVARPSVLDMYKPGKDQAPDKFQFATTDDTQLIIYHSTLVTHMNALCHFLHDRKMYNNRSQDLVTKEGAAENSIMPFKDGIVTRGVLMDMARHKNVDWLEPGDAIFPKDLEAWEKKAEVKVRSGDVMYVRTGRFLRRQKLGPPKPADWLAGLHTDCAKWMHERDIAIAASDGDLGVHPSPVTGITEPLHTICLYAMGMPTFDGVDLELVSQEAAKRRRWEFLTMAAPLAVPGGTGSAINPLAVF